ncbi:MAG: hypothetical protein LQ350_006671 [Teloschistes chrysophthalmus]|nr:MAG: hypothetical protein LQ350_006671 [Niorma chrysophthalma]
MTEEVHPVELQYINHLKAAAKRYSCPYCPFGCVQEKRLWEHAKKLHGDILDLSSALDPGQVRKDLELKASTKASKAAGKPPRNDGLSVLKPLSDDHDSLKPNIGDEVEPGSPTIPSPTPQLEAVRDSSGPEKKINDFGRLSLRTGHPGLLEVKPDALTTPNPLKRGPPESLETEQLDAAGQPVGHKDLTTRREKAFSGGPFVTKDPEFVRDSAPAKKDGTLRNPYGSAQRLYHADMDPPDRDVTIPWKSEVWDRPGIVGDPFVSRNQLESRNDILDSQDRSRRELDSRPGYTYTTGHATHAGSAPESRMDAKNSTQPPREHNTRSVGTNRETNVDTQPQMLLQPETRAISHAQLLVEVKGIYGGLVMVEAKCIEVDEKQSLVAMERDPSKKTELKDEQWQALITLHKQLLHEHHDFFLASQHPSASPALSKLAAKYTMPARMWRHGIHAFLEVLRHRLPGSLDHMLAFIYIAYSMMALLYETVTAFEETWIECLGDLGRYRMAIEDSSTGDREIWGGVARAWYNKAADKRPVIGRLYHHLAILARPYSLQQLAYYTRSLTSIEPFDSARASIMTFFQPILDGKTFNNHRSKALELAYGKGHAILFDRPHQEKLFQEIVETLHSGMLDGYIDRATANFKEQGVYIAFANIAALFEYGGTKDGHRIRRSIFWRAFMEVRKARQKAATIENPASSTTPFSLEYEPSAERAPSPPATDAEAVTATDQEASASLIRMASDLAFTTLSIALRRHGDRNVFPFVHVMFVFLWNLAVVEKAMEYVNSAIPWTEICLFLSTLAKAETMTPAVMNSSAFPTSTDKSERPLPEDHFMNGALFALDYHPKGWFKKNVVDEEERMMELPSMAAVRVERLLWLGVRIAEVCCSFTSIGYGLTFPPPDQQMDILRYNCPDFQASAARVRRS